MIQLIHKLNRKKITVAGLHLKAYDEFHEKRLEQTEIALEILKEHLFISNDEEIRMQPVILCGDFNGEYKEPFYSTVISNQYVKFTDAYTKNSATRMPTKKLVDYIFYTRNNLKLTNYLEFDKKRDYRKFPNFEYPSDHLSLVCDFSL